MPARPPRVTRTNLIARLTPLATEQKKSQRTHLLLGAMLLALAACNVLLIVQNLRLRAELGRYEVKGLQAGEKLGPFKAVGLDGRSV